MGQLEAIDNQPINFWGIANPVDDGAGGRLGVETVVYSGFGSVKTPKGSRNSEGGRTALKSEVIVTCWVDPAFTPQVGNTLEWLGQKFTMQQRNYVDAARLRWYIVALEQ